MRRIRYFICSRDLEKLVRNDINGLVLHKKRPKICPDAYCDEPLLEIVIEVVNPKKDATEPSSHKTKNYI